MYTAVRGVGAFRESLLVDTGVGRTMSDWANVGWRGLLGPVVVDSMAVECKVK